MSYIPNLLTIQSHVVFGHVGNSATVFPIQRIGIEVWPIHTVQFSNHTQYGMWNGEVLKAENITNLIDGISNIGELSKCNAILSGYLATICQGRAVLKIVEKIKNINKRSLYICDPVMADPKKSCILNPEMNNFFLEEAIFYADYLCPNQFELDHLCGHKANSLQECIRMAKKILCYGPKAVFVKNLNYPGKSTNLFEMLLVTVNNIFHIKRPLIKFYKQPAGVGDLTTGLFIARLLLGDTLCNAFQFTSAAVYEVLLETKNQNSYELEIIKSQDRIVSPRIFFKVTKL